jgi:phage recombination protein Bet
MAENPQAVVKKEPANVEYIPYGAQDKIKLSVAMVQNLIAVKTKTGKTCSDRDAIKFLAMCQAKRMNPFEGDCFLIGYDGREGPSFALVTAHQTYLKRAELHPEFDGMKSGIIVEEEGALKDLEGDFFTESQKVVGGWAIVYFKNRKNPMSKRLRLSRFHKGFGVWNDDPAGMICKCAEADALRSSFPTMLGGLYLREELEVDPKRPDFSKPLFTAPGTMSITNGHGAEPEAPVAPATERQRQADPAPVPPLPEQQPGESEAAQPDAPSDDDGDLAPQKGAFNPLIALRNLCKMANIGEGVLLDFLSQLGSTDGSVANLEELSLRYDSVCRLVCESWPSISKRILDAQKGAAK